IGIRVRGGHGAAGEPADPVDRRPERDGLERSRHRTRPGGDGTGRRVDLRRTVKGSGSVRRIALFLASALLAAGLGGTLASATTTAASRPAPVDTLVREAEVTAGPGGTLDLVVSLDAVASPALEQALARLG